MEDSRIHQPKSLVCYFSLDEIPEINEQFSRSTNLAEADCHISKENSYYRVTCQNHKFSVRPEKLNQLLLNLSKVSKRESIPSLKLANIKGEQKLLDELILVGTKHKEFASFFRKILSLQKFKSYKSFYLFLHEKGSTKCQKIRISQAEQNEEVIDVKNFDELFNSVKKSNEKSFSESTLKTASFNIPGTVLAKEFIFKNYSVVVVLTREDFLPQSNQDKQSFLTLCQFIKKHFESILQTMMNKKDTDLYLRLIEALTIREKQDLSLGLKQKIEEIKENMEASDHFHQQRVELLGELLNNLRHELSNPLFGIKLSSSILATELKDPDSQEMASQIEQSIDRSLEIINNFSNLYQEDKGIQKTSLKNLIHEVFTVSKSETKSITKAIQFFQNDHSQPDIQILVNQTILAQILFNLILNSAQAMAEASTVNPEINIKIVQNEEAIIINLSDNGPGIPQDKFDVIFTSFYTTKKSGTGLGLAISKSLAEKLGGTLHCVKSDKGAHFILEFVYEDLISRG